MMNKSIHSQELDEARLSKIDIDELKQGSKIVIKKSPLHGYGVFATEDIWKNEIIEEAPYVMTTIRRGVLCEECANNIVDVARFCLTYPCTCETCKELGRLMLLVAGHFMQYNCCEHENERTIKYHYNSKSNIITAIAANDIKRGEELLAWYGEGYYSHFVTNLNNYKVGENYYTTKFGSKN